MAQTLTEMQSRILNGFSQTLRNQRRNPLPTTVDRLIAESKIRTAAFAKRQAANPPPPFISHYNPNNPLNVLKGLKGIAYKEKVAQLIATGVITK